MNHVICTGDYVWVMAGQTSRYGFVQTVSTNQLGQTVYLVDGQFYSDPMISRSLKVGDTVFVRLNAGEQKPLLGRVLGLERLYGQEPWQCDLAVSLEVWDGGWFPMRCPVPSCDVRKASFRGNVPKERALVKRERVSP